MLRYDGAGQISSGVKFAKKADEILQRSAKPVYRPRCNDIDLATHDRFQKPIELRSFVAAFGAADAFVGEFVGSTEVRIRPQSDARQYRNIAVR